MDHQIQQLSRLGLKLQVLDTRVHKTPFVAITFEFSGMQIVHGLEPMSGPSYSVIRLRVGFYKRNINGTASRAVMLEAREGRRRCRPTPTRDPRP